jgi:hypothetical protein
MFVKTTQVRSFSAAGWLSSLLPVSTVPFTNRWLVAPALHAFAWGGEAGVFVPEGYKGIILDDHPVCMCNYVRVGAVVWFEV